MYCKPHMTVYDALTVKNIQASATSICTGGSVGVVCTGAEAAAPVVNCDGASIGMVICDGDKSGIKNDN